MSALIETRMIQYIIEENPILRIIKLATQRRKRIRTVAFPSDKALKIAEHQETETYFISANPKNVV